MSTPRANEFDQPIGPALESWEPCPFPDVSAMSGHWCRVEPLLADHADELYAELCAEGTGWLWTYLKQGPFATPADFADYVEARALATDSVSVLIRDSGGVACGLASYLRIDPGNGSVEVGNIVLGPRLQRTTASTEAQYLLARYAFSLGYRRYEWKCDSLNAPSLRAADRFGFVHEGRFRNAVVHKGRSRDTDWFSITDAEWPDVSAALVEWLDPANHAGGVQIRRLEAFRRAGAVACSEHERQADEQAGPRG